jgi:hypothetical protein
LSSYYTQCTKTKIRTTMVKGHNQDDQKKPNIQQGAKTLNQRQQEGEDNKGRNAKKEQSLPRSGNRKGANSIE